MTSKRKNVKKRVKTQKKSRVRTGKKVHSKPKFNLMDHVLVPRHELVSDEEKARLAETYGPLDLFPKILASDPVASQIGAKPGDVIKVIRPGEEAPTYRLVVEG